MNLPLVTAPSFLQSFFNALVALWSKFFGDRMDPVALPAALSDLRVEAGTRKYVSALRCNFVYDPTSALAAYGITVIASTIAGRWLREEPAPDAWGKQATWYVNPTTGSDLATGIDSGHAIQTLAEWKRRTTGMVQANMDVHLEESLPSTDPLPFRFGVEGPGPLVIHGHRTQVDAGTITGYDPEVPLTLPVAELTDAAQDWAPHVGRLVYVTVALALTITGSAGNDLQIGGADDQLPDIRLTAIAGAPPTLTACKTWEAFQGPTFNGHVLNCSNGAYIGP